MKILAYVYIYKNNEVTCESEGRFNFDTCEWICKSCESCVINLYGCLAWCYADILTIEILIYL